MPIWLIILISILGGLLLLAVLAYLIVELAFEKTYYKRGDGMNCIRYYHKEEFPNLNTEKISFQSGKNILHGYIYKDKKIKNYKAVILLTHGIGFGHNYHLTLINEIAKAGYIIVAYDFTASGISEGRRIKSMTQGIKDNEKALEFVTSNEDLNKYPLFLMGHSWGGYVALTSLSYAYKIEKVVSFCGFNSEIDMFTTANGLMKVLKPFVVLRNFFHYGNYSRLSASKALKNTNAKVLYIQGENDLVVKKEISSSLFKSVDNKNIRVEVLKDKGHSPMFTIPDEKEQATMLANFGMLGGVEVEPTLNIDYRKISEIDPDISKLVIEFLDN